MKVIRFNEKEGRLKLSVNILNDLWALQRIIFPGDTVKSESLRKFKSSESDQGEMKEVVISLAVEKVEFDKAAERLRIMGRILDGRPLEFVRLNSYHTLNVGVGDAIEISKKEWHDYLADIVKKAVADTKNARLGMIAVDDEKALPAYLLGYGVQFRSEIYSKLSKRMPPKEFKEEEEKYFTKVLDTAKEMHADTIIIAGPGFTKDDIKKFGEEKGIIQKVGKKLVFTDTSSAEMTGIYELIKSDRVADLLQKEQVGMEFRAMEEFLGGLAAGRSRKGVKEVMDAVLTYEAQRVIVNDSVLSRPEMQEVLRLAEERKMRIEIFNSDDEVGVQLHSFGDIGCS